MKKYRLPYQWQQEINTHGWINKPTVKSIGVKRQMTPLRGSTITQWHSCTFFFSKCKELQESLCQSASLKLQQAFCSVQFWEEADCCVLGLAAKWQLVLTVNVKEKPHARPLYLLRWRSAYSRPSASINVCVSVRQRLELSWSPGQSKGTLLKQDITILESISQGSSPTCDRISAEWEAKAERNW